MLEEAERLDAGENKLLDIGNMFLDCADRAIALPTDREHVAMVVVKEKVALVADNVKATKDA